jgi:DNA repair protein RadD
MQLRPYQETIVTRISEALMRSRRALLQLPTGAGKTICFCELLKRMMGGYPDMRTLILAHRQVLVVQAADKMRRVWEAAPIGMACVTAASKAVIHAPLTVASVQTLASRIEQVSEPYDLVIVDEAHRIPPVNEGGQYHDLLNAIYEKNPDFRILGVTATPFRTGFGRIYGQKNAFFPELTYRQSIKELQAQGYLAKYRVKVIDNDDLESDLRDVKITNGDYLSTDLTRVMSEKPRLRSAVRTVEAAGENRSHVVVFASSIDHAKALETAFLDAGFSARALHSKLEKEERAEILSAFHEGRLRFIISVEILTEGWDEEQVDEIIFCRPTQSTLLYIQMFGRGLRIFEGKKDLLVLDLAGNCERLGDPDDPYIQSSSSSSSSRVTEKRGRVCPDCGAIIPKDDNFCPCGYAFPAPPPPLPPPPKEEEENKAYAMREIELRGGSEIFVENVYAASYKSKKGNVMARIAIFQKGRDLKPIYLYLDIEGQASLYGLSKARQFWHKYCYEDFPREIYPETVDEFVSRFDEIKLPEKIRIKEENGFIKPVL